MKKYLALLLALTMCFALVACGSKKTEEEPVAEEPVAEEPAEAPAEEPAEEATASWTDFADVLTVAYAGLTEAQEPVIFVMNDDASFGALVIANTTSGESVSFVGDMTYLEAEDGSVGYTVTDETNGLELTFAVIDNGDGTLGLDCGDLGVFTIEQCDAADALDTLDVVDAAFVPVA